MTAEPCLQEVESGQVNRRLSFPTELTSGLGTSKLCIFPILSSEVRRASFSNLNEVKGLALEKRDSFPSVTLWNKF